MSRSLILFLSLSVQLLLAPVVLAQDIADEPISPDEVKLSARNVGGVLAPPGTAANFIEFPADPQGGGDLFDVVAADERAVISLVLPDGTEVTAANAGALGFAYTKAPAGTFDGLMIPNMLSTRGTHTIIILPPSAAPGTYKVRADVSSVTDVTDKIVVIASYFSSSSIRAGIRVDYQNRAGRPVLLAGLLFNDSSPVANASVTATVEERSQLSVPRVSVPLRDSGGADAEPGDGIYSGEFTPTRAGIYVVAMRATGVSPSGVPFARVVNTTFRVTEPLANFTSFHDAGVDDDFDGLFDSIRVAADVNVEKAGRYQFGITLLGGNGQKVNASTMADLQTGAQQVVVSFPAAEILHLGVGGPYAMKDALLTYQGDGEVLIADSREDAGQTAAYALAAIDRPELFFTGQGTAVGVDTNGNGKYDVLRVQTEVLVRFAGFHEWSGSIFDRNGRELGFFSGAGFLNAGSNTITFNFGGSKIGRGGVSGPYSLGSVLIFSSQASNVVNHVLDTPAFSYKEFEDSDNLRLGGVTVTETDGDLDNSIEPGEDGTLLVRLSNVGAAGMTNVSATLTSSTPGVAITAGQFSYPDLGPSGSAVNTTPFAFSLGNVPCGQKVEFTLTVSHAEDGGVPSVVHFSVQTGRGSQATYSYAGPAVAIPDGNSTGVSIPLAVSGFSGNIEDLNFRFDGSSCTSAQGATTVGLDHSWVGDLVVTLTSPQGTTVTLMSRPGGGSFGSDGNNFCNTTLDDEGGAASIQTITAAGAPYTGAYTPAAPLAAFRGQNPNGTWTLRVSDRVSSDTGSVRAFSLALTGAPSCADNAAPRTTAARMTAPNAAGWNNTDAAIALSAADNKAGSGVREITYSATGAGAFPATTVPGPSASVTVTAEGLTTINFSATDNAGNVEATQSITVMIDKTAPSIAITSPAAANYMLNQVVAARYTCSDGGSGVAACVGSAPDGGVADTSTAGAHTFTATAEDAAGNAATVSVVYHVVNAQTYNIRLLYDPDKVNRIGSTIPVKIQVLNALTGQNVSSPDLAVHALAVRKESDFASGPVEDAGQANPDDDFRFNNFEGVGGYIFNLKTTDLTAGTYVLVFKVGNDSFTYGARFQLK